MTYRFSMISLRTFPLTATLCVSLAGSVFAQNISTESIIASCSNFGDNELNQALLYPNATGSYSTPAFSRPGKATNITISAGGWTWNTAIIVNDYNQLRREFWIETFNLQGLKNSDIPFQGCVAGFDALPRSNYIRGQNDSADCLSTLN